MNIKRYRALYEYVGGEWLHFWRDGAGKFWALADGYNTPKEVESKEAKKRVRAFERERMPFSCRYVVYVDRKYFALARQNYGWFGGLAGRGWEMRLEVNIFERPIICARLGDSWRLVWAGIYDIIKQNILIWKKQKTLF